MAVKRRRRTDYFVAMDAFLILIAAVLVFLAYREINSLPVISAAKTATDIFPVSGEFTHVSRLLVSALGIMATTLLLTAIFLLPMIRKTHDDSISIAKRAESAERQAVTDPLTGLHNRRYFESSLKGYLEEFGRHQLKFGLMILDLDHFKSVNDNFGHDVGDMVLREIALRLRAVSREHDVIARYGGEEFAIITPVADEQTLIAIADRYRINIELLKINVGNTVLRPTVSIGVAVSTPETEDLHDLFRHADQKLYEAKSAGRNRVAA